MVYGPSLPPGGLKLRRSSDVARVPDAEEDSLVAKALYQDVPLSNDNSTDFVVRNAWPEDAGKYGCGLSNLGNSCYLNSVLQCLTHLPPFANLAWSKYHRPVCRSGGLNGCAYCMVASRLQLSLKSRATDPPRRIHNRLHVFGKQFAAGRQEDAHEMLRHLVDACERDLLRHEGRFIEHTHIPNPSTAVNHLFQGTLRSQVKCLSCGHESNTYDPFMDLSLELLSCHSLHDALHRFTAPEHLDGANRYRCDACRALVPARKQITVHHPPNILVVHLKRFDTTFGSKITRRISFPDSLPLHPFLSHPPSPVTPTAPPPAAAGPSPSASPARPHPPTRSHPAAPDAHYTLHGVLVHQGFSSHSGHYFSFVRSGDARPSWWCMNDACVSPSSLDNVKNQQAYILFYVASHMHPLQPIPPATPSPPAATATPLQTPPSAISPSSSSASAPIAPTSNGTAHPHSQPQPQQPYRRGDAPAPSPHPPSSNGTHTPPPEHPASNGTCSPRAATTNGHSASWPSPTANGNGNGSTWPSTAANGNGSAAPQPPKPGVTHFAAPRKVLTKQSVAKRGPQPQAADQVAASAAASADVARSASEQSGARPPVPDAVLALTRPVGNGGAPAEAPPAAAANGHADMQGGAAAGGVQGGAAAEQVREPAATPAAAAASTPAAANSPLEEGQQRQQERQQHNGGGVAGSSTGVSAAGSSSSSKAERRRMAGAAASAGAEGGRAAGSGQKRKWEEDEWKEAEEVVQGKKRVGEKLLDALRSHSYKAEVRALFEACLQRGESEHAALQTAKAVLRRQVPLEVKQEGYGRLKALLEASMPPLEGPR